MVLVRLLQRKDAASLVVAIAAGLMVASFVGEVTSHLSAWLSGLESEVNFQTDYWQPFITFVVQIVALELLARVVIALRGQLVRRG